MKFFGSLSSQQRRGEKAGKKSMPKDNTRPCSGTSSLRQLLLRPRPCENFVQESNIILGSHTFSEFHSMPGHDGSCMVHDVLLTLGQRDRISPLNHLKVLVISRRANVYNAIHHIRTAYLNFCYFVSTTHGFKRRKTTHAFKENDIFAQNCYKFLI